MAAAELPPGPHGPALRLGSQNVNGITTPAAAEQAAAAWHAACFDIVFVQEHHLSLVTLTPVQRRLAQRGWTIYAALAAPPPAGGRARGGTALAVRTQLVRSGALRLVPPQHGQPAEAAVRRDPGGRYTAARVDWCGHRLQLCSLYLPSGEPAAQRAFITDSLRPLAATAGAAQLLWAGDFNFTPVPHLDRLGHQPGAPHPDIGTYQRWQAAMPPMLDVWRERHPGRRGFTYIRPNAASRLDRFLVSPALLPTVATCSIRARSTSDHRPVSLTLLPRTPPPTGPGLRRARLAFLERPELAAQLRAWLQEQLGAAPADGLELLLWWPQFKRRLLRQCAVLHRASRQLSAAAEAAGEQLEALHAQLDAGDDAVLPDIVAARQQFAAAAAASAAEAARQRRRDWLHRRERPCPPLTARLRPPRAERQVAALRAAGGQLITRGTACAQRVADYWAGVSAQPAVDQAAQQEVLQALAQGRRLGAQQAAALGDPQVAAAEVLRAMRTAPSGKAPGHDGIPVELYRHFKTAFAPILARLFTAIATHDTLPARFTEGIITIIFKGGDGDRTDPAAYRPITLLCTDYRLYAKALALRLSPHLASIIDAEQTAFVPGRRIGENIMTLQCLSELLRRSGRSAVVAFCDFRKAYDAIDRGFLLSAMAALGVGAGFVAMVRRLLTATAARGLVNGFTSTPTASAAGVRQGCPLSPLLYLFIGQALLALLRARGCGIDVAGRRLTALQYADDTEAILPSLDAVPAFQAAMATFAGACGQQLNPAKTRLLPIGAVPAGLPQAVGDLRVVRAATSLGVTFGAAEDPTASWPALMAGVEACYTRVAGLPSSFSIFGRGFAASAYGVSKLLYHAEFTGHPPEPHLARLATITAKLIERRLAPNDGRQRFAGLAAWLLPGRPADGGFGALAWREHITSRHAWWALQLILAPADTPWVAVARALLRSCAAAVGHHPWGLLAWPAGEPLPGTLAPRLPAPLQRLREALAALPRPSDVAEEPLAAGAWCWALPLWGSPLLATPEAPDGIDRAFLDLATAGVATLGQLLRVRQAIAANLTAAAYPAVHAAHLGGYPPFADRHYALGRVDALLAALPDEWVQAARAAAADIAAGRLQPPSPDDAARVLLSRLGWRLPGRERPLLLTAFTVRDGTTLLTTAARQRRTQQRLQPYAEQLLGTLGELQAALRRLWQLPWENCHKEPFWRLVYDAFPTAARMHIDEPCACGGAPADLEHHYWACPVARAVTASIAATFPAPPPAAGGAPAPAPFAMANVWLARAPRGVHSGVWDVACLAAVEAMDHGRRSMYAMRMGPAEPPPAADVVRRASRSAVARFWCLLADFVGLGGAPPAWRAACPPGHPLLFFDPAAGRWAVDRPVMPPATPQ